MTATTVAVIAAPALGPRACGRARSGHRANRRRHLLPTVVAVIVGMIPIGFGATPTAASAAVAGPTEPPMTNTRPVARNDVPLDLSKIDLPLAFEQNQGQTDAEIDFLTRGHGYQVFLGSGDATIALGSGESGFAVRMDVVGGAEAPGLVPIAQQPAHVNYFIGDDPAGWQTKVPTYGAVEYRDVYPGIDLRYYGNNRQLEYDFIVQPGADPNQIALTFDGATSLAVTETDELEIGLNPGRTVTFSAPLTYQDTPVGRVVVESAYRLADDTVTFALGGYDPAVPLIIDPTLDYSTYLGGADVDQLYDVAADGTGASYAVGAAKIGYPTTVGAFQTSATAGFDVVVTKVAPDGQSLVYSTYIGGGSDEFGYAIAVDGSGSAYITGETGSDDYPTPGSPFDGNRNGLDAFVTKLSADGSALSYSSFLGGDNGERGDGIEVDASGNAYVIGYTLSGNFPTQSPYDGTLGGSSDGFVTKVNPTGAALVYSTYLGGTGLEEADGIALDGFNQVWITGFTASTDFPTTAGTYRPTRADSSRDVFISAFDAAGSAPIYGTYLGGTSLDEGYGIDLDSTGNVYVTGLAQASFPATAGAWDTTFSSGDEIFVAKFDPSLTGAAELIYSGFIGDSGIDRGTGLAIDAYGQAHVVGYTQSAGLATADGYDQTQNSTDGLMAIISADGSAKLYASYLGGSSDDYGHGIALEGGKIHVTGYTTSGDFPMVNAYDNTASSDEGWLMRFAAQAAPITGYTVNSTADVVDQNVGDGSCDTGNLVVSDPECTLRAAIQEANASAIDEIILPAGTYTLTITGTGDDDAAKGDLDINSDLTISGAGAASTIVQGGTTSSNGIDRVFHVKTGTATITGITIRHGQEGDGAAVLVVDDLTLEDVVLADNTASKLGGGVFVSGSAASLTVRRNTFSGGSAEDGGGVAVKDGTLVIEDSTFAGNAGTRRGGGVHNDGGNVTVARTTITGNSAGTDDGGGLLHRGGGVITVTNSTFSGNSAGRYGGGVYSERQLDIYSSTVAGNTAGTSGGGVHRQGDTLRIKNTIVAGNTGGNCSGSPTSLGHNLEDTSTCGFSQTGDQVNIEPLLGSLQDNGGYALTHALLTGSPAIDAGTDSGAPTTDQRGATRPKDGDLDSTPVTDVGAYEYDPYTPLAVDDAVTTEPDVPVVIDVLDNDSDPTGDPLSIDSFTQGSNGTVGDNGDDTLTYAPNPAWTGVDTFTYVTTDGTYTDEGTVTVTVAPHSDPMAVWRRSGQSTPFYDPWDGSTFGGTQTSAGVGDFRIIQGAESPSRDEAIVVGVDTGGTIAGEMWDGISWAPLPMLGSNQSFWWGFDVAYESVSGDAVVVYADGTGLSYRVWNGETWSDGNPIPEPPGGTPRQMQLAAHPWADEMVLIVSNDSSQDYAVVWDGSAWGNALTLDGTGTGNDRTDVNVAYEQQSGRALVVWGSGNDDVHFRLWDAGWSNEFVTPGIGGGYSRWITLASDPSSDNIAVGVLTNDSDVWLAVWNGSGWVDQYTATTSTTGTTEPAVAVAFEGLSGRAIATYGESASAPRYRIWTSGSGWSTTEASTNGIGDVPNSMMLYGEPGADGVMLAVNDDSGHIHYQYWNGSTWGPDNELETNSGETKNQPFLFLWEGVTGPPGNSPPVFDQDILDRVEAEATLVSLSSVATDPDVGDTLTYSATGLPLGLSIDSGTGLISGLVNYYAAASSPYSVEITVCDDGTPNECDSDTFTWTITNVLSNDPYAVATIGGANGGDDLLTEVDLLDFDPVTNEVDIGVGTGTVSLHGVSIEPISGVLYAADGDRLGTLNVDSGVFTAVGGTFGSGDGDQGTVTFDDVRGLTFQPLTGRLFALHHQPGDRDLLFVVDTATGLAVPNLFAGSRDYVELRSSAPVEATDIALDPSSWQIYGTFTDGVGNFELRRINRWNGATNVVGALTPEIRGLSFDSTGQMWGTDGGALYQINKSTAAATNPRTLDNGSDYQAVALAIPPFFPPSVEGTIFEDVAGDAVPAGEFVGDFLNPGLAGATVRMYLDDGAVAGEPDAGDTLWSSKTTGPGGHYFFSSIPAGVYWLTVDSSTLVPTAGGTGWAEQTYGPAEAVTFDGSYSFAASAGPLYGGMRTSVSDDVALLASSEHVVRVDLSPGEEIEQVDLGFSFNVVTNVAGGDGTSPQGSLRQFITNANTGTGPNPLRFVPVVASNATDGGTNNWWSLAVTSSLPAITGSGTTIDGSAFDAADGVTALNSNVAGPELELEGSGAGGSGLEIAAGTNEIRELVINGFDTGIAVLGGDANVIAGNYLGPDATGLVGEVGNTSQGIYVYGATNTVVGGSSIFDRNTISGNRLRGVFIDDYSDGAPAISNRTQVIGNYIGIDASGSAALPYDSSPQYQQIGIAIWAGPDNVIGTATAGNLISGNSWHGVYIWGADASGNKIQGNTIGLDAGGSSPVPNGYDSITRAGIHISSAPGNLIGGIGAEGNVIVSNAARGVVIFGAAAVDNAVIGNTIYDNGDIGIDLQLDGVTLNDPGDVDDTAANDLLNFPEITSALESTGVVTVLGTFDLPAGDYRFEFFVNPSGADSSGYGEGQSLVHSYAVIAHPGGSAAFSTSFAGSGGDIITATATEDLGAGDYGSTSEFSLAVTASGAPLIVNSTSDAGDSVPGNGVCDTGGTVGSDPECTLRAAIEEANDPSTAVDTIWFAIPAADPGHAAGVWTIAPGSDLPEITAAVTLDATTQSGWSALPVIELDGFSLVGALPGVRINSSDVALRGLAVGNFPADGISVAGDDVTIAAMNVGVGADGSTDIGNGAGGIVVTTGDRVTIGGSDPLDRNIIGNNVSVAITVNDSDDSVIRGNYIGVQVDGVTPAPNSEGIRVFTSANLQVGGAGANDGNVISANTWEGITLDTLTDGAQVRGNLIGVGIDGSTPVGNGWIGVNNMTGSTNAVIGGRNPGEANTIAHNGDAGVRVLMSAQLPEIVGNRIHDNVGLGIDVGIAGVNPPDPGDVDGHPNQPVLLTAHSSGGSTTLDLAFDRAAGDYLIDFYSNPGGGDPSGYGEGAQLIATFSVTHDGSGPELLRYVVPVSGSTITATATSVTLLETSEFSNAIDDVAGANTLVADSSIRRSDLYSAQGAPAVVPGVAGGAHELDGVSDHLVGPGLDVTDSALTISGWVQLDTAIGQHSVISKRDGSGNVVYELGVDGGTSEAVATVRLSGAPIMVRGGAVSTGVWQQLSASWDGAELVLYVDGAEVDRTAATGTLATDATTCATVGARDDGTRRLDGRVDHVSVGHDPLTAAEIAVRHVNVETPAVLVTLGDEQTGVPGAWTATTDQSRSGSYSLAAPETTGPGTAAWAVATGIDEPGLVFESWWWMTTATGVDLAAGTRAGPAPVDQYSAAGVGPPFEWELRHPTGAGDVIDGTVAGTATTGAWVKVEMWTDQLGDSRLIVDDVEMIGWTSQGAGLISGSAALLVSNLPSGERWHIDDPRARKLVTPEPVASLRPLDRG